MDLRNRLHRHKKSAPKPNNAAATVEPLTESMDRHAPDARNFAVRFWDGSVLPPISNAEPQFTIRVNSPDAVAYLVRNPNELGLGRAWTSGQIEVDGELQDVLQVRNKLANWQLTPKERVALTKVAWQLGAIQARPPKPPKSEAHPHGRRHTLRRDRNSVRHHYDVSNEFYRLVLGPSMVYSCAYFETSADSLEVAQERKLDRICRKLALKRGERFLDVGCGWGSLVIHAAKHYGAQAVGVTLSEPQAELAQKRIEEAGLTDRCEVRVADYREISDGPYDKLASVGMCEHVGSEQLLTYTRKLHSLMRPGGLLLNHGIVRTSNSKFRANEFMARYVFPDGELQQIRTIIAKLEKAGFEIRDLESMREHYALTLRRWLANLHTHRDAAIAAAGEERERIWKLYMNTSVQGFEQGTLSVHQVLATASGAPHNLPLARKDLLQQE